MIHIERTRLQYNTDVPDHEIAWAIQLHHSRGQIEWCLDLLRAAYPTSRVVLISDGDGEDYRDIATRHQCRYVRGEHLHALETCHLYVRRLLTALADGAEAYCFKIDPDTAVWRRFTSLPAFSALFGTPETITEGRLAEIHGAPNVQGGCIGMTRDVVDDLLASDALSRENCVERHLATWARCDDMVRTAARGQFCDDFVLSWAARHIDVPICDHPEIKSRWRRLPASPHAYAITHPHKLSRT
jgi:hypothetical protein